MVNRRRLGVASGAASGRLIGFGWPSAVRRAYGNDKKAGAGIRRFR